VRVQVNLLSGE